VGSVTQETDPILILDQRRRTARLAYAGLFLVVTTALFTFLPSLLANHLIDAGKFSLLWEVDEYSPFTWASFCLVQFLLALLFFRPAKSLLVPATLGAPTEGGFLPAVGFGLVTGVAALAVTAPTFLWGHAPSAVATFFLDHLYGIPDLALLIVLLILLPIAAELLFRGVFFARLLEISTIGPALILSSLLFAWAWQVLNPAAAFVFSLASGILFYRTRSVLSCIVANCVFTLGGLSVLLVRAIYRS
jgi:membrane protease YdiL (CAAX protease family)